MRIAATGLRIPFPGRIQASPFSFLWLFLLLVVAGDRFYAAVPVLDGFFPAGGARGTTNAVSAAGKSEVWPPEIWVQGEGVTFQSETNKGKLSLHISADACPGPRLVRFYNDEGASEPRIFVIGDGREAGDTEPNNHFAKPQRLQQFPVTLNGRLDKNGDVDSFAIELRARQWLDATVDCYRLGSKVDAVFRLVTTNGQQLAWNHDFITLDPRLIWHAVTDQVVVLQIFGFAYPPASEIALTGGDAAVYRLHLLVTNNVFNICGSPAEREPNDRIEAAQQIHVPAIIEAAIDRGEDEDRFRFSVREGEFIEARLEAASLGSPLDAWLKIENPSGNEVARSDDAGGSRDPRVEWKPLTNGQFIVAVGSVTHRGGEDFCYHLFVQRADADFRATLAANSMVLTPGATNELKFEFKRLRGFTNELTTAFRELPEGVTALATNFSQKDGTVSIQLAAAADAPKFQGPIKLLLVDTVSKEERGVPFELTTRGETGFNQLLVETSDQLWLTVRPKPAETPKAAAKQPGDSR